MPRIPRRFVALPFVLLAAGYFAEQAVEHPPRGVEVLTAEDFAPPSSSTTTTITPTTLPPTTTTVAPPPPTTTTTRARPAPAVSARTAGVHQALRCGGALPPCWVLRRENPQGDPAVWNGGCHAPHGWTGGPPCPNGRSTASGIWQIVRGTWGRFGGYVNAADAPIAVQEEHAARLWAGGRGCSHWSAC